MDARTATRAPPTPVQTIHALPDGTRVQLSFLGSDDRDDFMAGFASLSRRTRYLRFFTAMAELPAAVADRLLDTDLDNHVAIAARLVGRDGRIEPMIVGVARYHRRQCGNRNAVAEPAAAVVDALQGRGLGRLLLRAIARYARAHGVEQFRAYALADNQRIRKILRASNGVLVDTDWPVLVYDVDIAASRSKPEKNSVGR